MLGWLIYWSLAPIALVAILIAGDANTKMFIDAVGFWPVFLIGIGYLFPAILLSFNDQ